ncbi:uncharacterized protein LOC119293090 [Triticum dicoccoides]|uniref:uncharacterized protein LOC119293090 n=1 Tax=Triticum dicoccoides TaxID=85692 RepID=UPI00188E9573|nr:uncharacterized protein LOC119293090 [Triticum dicoccoides]
MAPSLQAVAGFGSPGPAAPGPAAPHLRLAAAGSAAQLPPPPPPLSRQHGPRLPDLKQPHRVAAQHSTTTALIRRSQLARHQRHRSPAAAYITARVNGCNPCRSNHEMCDAQHRCGWTMVLCNISDDEPLRETIKGPLGFQDKK